MIVMVKIHSNAILVELMKNRKDAKMIRVYNALLLWLKWAGMVLKKHVLDNEVSEKMKNHICNMCKLDMELVPPGCHRRNAAKVAIHNFKGHFLSVLADVAKDLNQTFGIGCSHKPRAWSIWFNNLMPPPTFWHVHISADPLTTTKCHLLQWDVRPRCMRNPTNAVHGHIIPSTDGISSHHQNIFAHTIVTSSTPRANNYLIQSNFNTNTSPIPPSHMPTRQCTHRLNASKPSKVWWAKPGTLKLRRTYNESLTQHKLTYRQIPTIRCRVHPIGPARRTYMTINRID